MKNSQMYTDKISISLSILCVVHCLALPLILVFMPSTLGLLLEGEAFHLFMIFVVLPISAYALTMGCQKHKNKQLVVAGAAGLAFLIAGIALEHVVGEFGEKALTLIGASILALVHFKNYRLCKKVDCSHCGEQHKS